MSFGASYPLLNNVLHIPSTRQPLDIRSTITYLLPPCLSYIVVAILVILPGTRTLRIAVWPLIAILAFRAAVYVDLSNGDPKNTFRNVQLEVSPILCVIVLEIRCILIQCGISISSRCLSLRYALWSGHSRRNPSSATSVPPILPHPSSWMHST